MNLTRPSIKWSVSSDMFEFSRTDKLQAFDRGLNSGLFAATTALLTIAYFTAFRPLGERLEAVGQEIEQLDTLAERTSEISTKHQELEKRLALCRQNTSELWQRIPSAPRESDFLAQVCQLAERTGMQVVDYHPGIVEQLENHHELEVKFRTHGEYKSLCRFLEQVDRIPRLSRMTHLEIVAQSTDTLSVELTYRIYFAPPRAVPAAKKG